VTVGAGGSLGGKGTINGNVHVQNGGMLYSGDSSITTVNGNVNLDTGATSAFSIANTATLDNILFKISSTGDLSANSTLGGHDVVLTAYSVPEPGTWMLLLGGLVLLAWRFRVHQA